MVEWSKQATENVPYAEFIYFKITKVIHINENCLQDFPEDNGFWCLKFLNTD